MVGTGDRGGGIHLAAPLFVDASKEYRFRAWEIQSKKVNDNKREGRGSLLGEKTAAKEGWPAYLAFWHNRRPPTQTLQKPLAQRPSPPRGSCRENIIIHLLVFSCTFEVKVWSG